MSPLTILLWSPAGKHSAFPSEAFRPLASTPGGGFSPFSVTIRSPGRADVAQDPTSHCLRTFSSHLDQLLKPCPVPSGTHDCSSEILCSPCINSSTVPFAIFWPSALCIRTLRSPAPLLSSMSFHTQESLTGDVVCGLLTLLLHPQILFFSSSFKPSKLLCYKIV